MERIQFLEKRHEADISKVESRINADTNSLKTDLKREIAENRDIVNSL